MDTDGTLYEKVNLILSYKMNCPIHVRHQTNMYWAVHIKRAFCVQIIESNPLINENR